MLGHSVRICKVEVVATSGYTQFGKGKKRVSISDGVSRTHLIEHAEVFAIAVKYQIDALRKLAAEKFKEGVAFHWNHVEFAEATYLAYTNTPEDVKELRDIAADAIDKHANELLKRPEIEALICSINGLAYEVLKRGRRSPPSPKCEHCESTGKHFRCDYRDGYQYGNQYGPCNRCGFRCESHKTTGISCGHRTNYMVPMN